MGNETEGQVVGCGYSRSRRGGKRESFVWSGRLLQSTGLRDSGPVDKRFRLASQSETQLHEKGCSKRKGGLTGVA